MEVDIVRVKEAIDCRNAISEGLQLSKKMPNKAFCPFHQDTNPSLTLYQNRWYCFGCNRGGDIFDWYMLRYGISFKEAVAAVVGTDENIRLVHVKERELTDEEKQWVESAAWVGSAWKKVLVLQDEKNRIRALASKRENKQRLVKLRRKWAELSSRQKKTIDREFAFHVKRMHSLEEKVKSPYMKRVIADTIMMSADVEPFIYATLRYKMGVIRELVWDH